ncbi:hypothetical protein MBLNU459_g0363t1 [Dothideomycetes sp. NU459]
MPSSNDEALNQEDTPDEVKGSKPSSRKKKQKKTAKSRIVDDYKDSSSEEPKLSPDLSVDAAVSSCRAVTHADSVARISAPVARHTSPSPPLSPPSDPSAPPEFDHPDGALDPLDKQPPPFHIPALQPDTNAHNLRIVCEPSPPQDDLGLGQDGVSIASQAPQNGNTLQNAVSLSSSPQGGIRLPSTVQYRPLAASPPGNRSMPSRERTTSISSHMARSPAAYEPPPPHMPQRHFLRLPDLDAGLSKGSDQTVVAGTRGYFCGFDSLEGSNAGSSPAANNVILLGWEGGLDVYRLLRHRSDIVGRLEGLRGSVIDAKILPWVDRDDPLRALRPLVACTIHGPVLKTDGDIADGRRNTDEPSGKHAKVYDFQTSVEVYSLLSSQHVATLFQTPTVPLQYPVTHPLYKVPPSVGNLSIAAEGRFVTITSGKSGEIYVFSPYIQLPPGVDNPFRCVGKFWTCVRNRPAAPEAENKVTGENTNYEDADRRVPFMALSQRWLAIKPPVLSSSQITLQGTPTLSDRNPEPPGVSMHASPPAPLPNCEVDAPIGDSLLNRVTKQATQEIRKGAQWVGEQGMQAWRSYWNRPVPANGGSPYQDLTNPSNEQMLFPPTHGHNNEPQQLTIEPAQVSIIDLYKLIDYEESRNKGASAPLATFSLVDGCSFLSFAPNGLSLLATNHMGDASSIWDLTRITDGRVLSRPSASAAGTQCFVGAIRLSARFIRMSPSVVIHVAWAAQGNRIAILTERGTVHLHELPRSEYSVQPYTSPKAVAHTHSGLPSPSSSPQDDLPPAGLINNVRAGWQSIHGLAARSRSGSQGLGLPTLSTLGHASAAARYAGGRAVRHGFSRGLGMAAEGAHHIRHAEDNKIRLRPARHVVAARCVKWLGGRDQELIATVADGKIALQVVKSGFHMQGKRTVVSLAASRKPVAEFALQPIGSDTMVAATARILDKDGPQGICAREGPHGFWMLNKANAVRRASMPGEKNFAATVTQDKETSPPYMPFHRVPQVSLFTFTDGSGGHSAKKKKKAGSGVPTGQGSGSDEAWVFGLALTPATRINCQQFTLDEDFGQDMTDDMQGTDGKMDGAYREDMDLLPPSKSRDRELLDLL